MQLRLVHLEDDAGDRELIARFESTLLTLWR